MPRVFRYFNTFIGFKEVGGIDGLWEKYPLAVGKPLVRNITGAILSNSTSVLFNTSSGNTSSINSTIDSSSCYGGVEPYWANMFR